MHRTDGAQIVLTTRPFATDAVMRAAPTAQLDRKHLMVHTVKPLTMAAAREPVQALQDGHLRLTGPFAEGLARAARATPLLAIVAVEMIRRGELSTALGLDPNLQQEIMTRYGEVASDGVAGASAQHTRKILATVAALSQVRLDDKPLIDAMATFLGMARLEMLQTIHALTEHGALLDRGGAVEVVPEMLGEQLLGEQTVVMGQASGFSDELWQAFPQHRLVLVVSLGQVDWRLQHVAARGGTSATDVFSSIWSDFRTWFLNLDPAERSDALDALPAVAATQPARVRALLRDTIALPGLADPDWSSAGYIRRRCAAVAGICAAVDFTLLSDVFDLLWEIARTDGTDPNSDPSHPVRVLEQLTDLGTDGNLTVAGVLLDRVAEWLNQPADATARRSPLGLLEPLLAKSGTTQHWQPNALEFRAYTVTASSVRDIRDRIRQLLAPIMIGADVARAVESVELLGTGLREAIGYFGREISPDIQVSWTDDDLRTLAVLSDTAETVTEPLVRCHIRLAIVWHAAYATSVPVREAVRTLQRVIKSHDEDLLTDLLVTADYDHFSFEDIDPFIDPAPTGQALDGQTALAAHERTVARREQERLRVAEELWQSGGPGDVGLDRGFSDQPTALIAWIRRAANATGRQRDQWSRVWSVVAGNPIRQGASTAISAIATEGTADEMHFLAQSLQHCPKFALDQPVLVSEIVTASSTTAAV